MPVALRLATVAIALLPLAVSAQTRNPVLVELFTSEGCSSCPPADKLLAALQAQQPVSGAQIVVLEEHVDYWEGQGWHDRFSSSLYTNRQRGYALRLRFDDPYTPQMIVDGSTQFVGNDPSKALSSIAKAAQSPKIALDLSPPTVDGKHISSTVSAPGKQPLPHGDLYAALVDLADTTEVKGGENRGKHLDHVSVARSFQRIGKLQDLSKGPVSFRLSVSSAEPSSHMGVVVFAQLPDQGAVRGVTSSPIGSAAN
ncbi:MAG: DUF1223 domain-containing protein [Acidobacteria bacterium]|nr:DUF1223 domain-containing protein [Acidobacteriota bacterium]